MTREIAPYGLRMPNDMREELEHHARRAGRSLNAEINARLLSTLQSTHTPYTAPPSVSEPPPDYTLNKPERDMLSLFRAWPATRQLAFLSLFE